MKESEAYVGRERRFDRLDNLTNQDYTGLTTSGFGLTRGLNDGIRRKIAHLMRQWDKPVPDKAHNERHERTDKGADTGANSQSTVAVR